MVLYESLRFWIIFGVILVVLSVIIMCIARMPNRMFFYRILSPILRVLERIDENVEFTIIGRARNELVLLGPNEVKSIFGYSSIITTGLAAIIGLLLYLFN